MTTWNWGGGAVLANGWLPLLKDMAGLFAVLCFGHCWNGSLRLPPHLPMEDLWWVNVLVLVSLLFLVVGLVCFSHLLGLNLENGAFSMTLLLSVRAGLLRLCFGTPSTDWLGGWGCYPWANPQGHRWNNGECNFLCSTRLCSFLLRDNSQPQALSRSSLFLELSVLPLI